MFSNIDSKYLETHSEREPLNMSTDSILDQTAKEANLFFNGSYVANPYIRQKEFLPKNWNTIKTKARKTHSPGQSN
jgi:hypothetical protein